jgi:hypothetical protein
VNTNTQPGFTATIHHGSKAGANCYGRGRAHNHPAVKGNCDGCGAEVAKTDNGRLMPVGSSYGYMYSYACWGDQHVCDPERAATYGESKAARIESGEIIKGQTVTVVKGRKVPKGTTGIVAWMGEDNYGTARVGFKTADGEMVFTAQSNVEVTND